MQGNSPKAFVVAILLCSLLFGLGLYLGRERFRTKKSIKLSSPNSPMQENRN